MSTDTALVIATIPTALLFVGAGGGKLAGVKQSLEVRDHLAIPAERWRQIGMLELAGVAGILAGLGVRPLGIAAAAGLALTSGGAIATHVRARDAFVHAAPAVVALALSMATLVLGVAAS